MVGFTTDGAFPMCGEKERLSWTNEGQNANIVIPDSETSKSKTRFLKKIMILASKLTYVLYCNMLYFGKVKLWEMKDCIVVK